MHVARHRHETASTECGRDDPASGLATFLQAYERHMQDWEASCAITSNERRILAWLTESTTSDELVAATGLDDGAVAATLALLRQARFVDLEWSDDADDECSRVTPTARGLQVALGMQASLGEVIRVEQLEAARGAHRRNDEATAELLAMASHELRTPLTTIAGFTSTMLSLGEELDRVRTRRYLKVIETQAARLQRLVDDLHLYSRVESGHLPVHTQEVDTSVAIRQAIQDLAVQDVGIVCPSGLVARVDLDHLQQMLGNYISNAIKYGAAPVTVEAERAGGSIVIAVCDRGRGVAELFAPKLFERFERGGPHREIAGSGLGLSIVRGLARAQGGDAWYEPNAPRGSRFCVRLPHGA